MRCERWRRRLGLALGAWAALSCGAQATEEYGSGGSSGAGTSNAGTDPSGGSAGTPVEPTPPVIIEDGGVEPLPNEPAPFPENCGPLRHCAEGVPLEIPLSFSGPPGPSEGTAIVYPFERSMHPENFGDLSVHWTRSPEHRWFRIRVENDANETWEMYAPCAQGPLPAPSECMHTLDPAAWLHIARKNAGNAVRMSVTGLNESSGTVAVSAPITLLFSDEPLLGAVYYWATNRQGILRALADAPKATPFIVPRSATNSAACAGCHALSRDGKVIAFSSGDSAFDTALQVAQTDLPEAPTVSAADQHQASVLTLNPDGSRVLVTTGYRLVLRDTQTGAELGSVDPLYLPEQKAPFFPEWSPSGEEIALTLAPLAQGPSEWSVSSGDIAVLPYNGGSFGPARTIVRATPEAFHFYPSWSPDGQWLLFASAPPGAAADGAPRVSYNQALASLHLVRAAGGPVYTLSRALHQPGNTSTWPKFAPFSQRAGNLLFFTFNSKKDYGFLLKNQLRPESQRSPQLWLAALDLDALDGGDPSFSPVWLPAQEVDQNNHLAYWTEELRCRDDEDCGGSARCTNGACISIR